MSKKFTQVRETVADEIIINAGVLLSEFSTSDGTYDKDDILCASSGGLKFSYKPNLTDWGEDIDNVPSNTADLLDEDDPDVSISGTAVSWTEEFVAKLLPGFDNTSGHIVHRGAFDISKDFADIWMVADYTRKNSATSGGYIAIHLKTALNTGGLSINTSDNGKATGDFEFHPYKRLDSIDEMPVEIYMKEGT